MAAKLGRKPDKEPKILISGFYFPLAIAAKLDKICSKKNISRRDFFKLAVERAGQ